MINRIFTLFVVLFFLVPLSAFSEENKEIVLIILDASNSSEMRTVMNFIETNGGHNIHIYPPSVLIAKIPDGLKVKLQQHPLVRNLETTVVDPSQYSSRGTTTVYALEAWNNNFQGLSKSKGLDEPPSPHATPLVGDAILEKDEEPPIPIEKKTVWCRIL